MMLLMVMIEPRPATDTWGAAVRDGLEEVSRARIVAVQVLGHAPIRPRS